MPVPFSVALGPFTVVPTEIVACVIAPAVCATNVIVMMQLADGANTPQELDWEKFFVFPVTVTEFTVNEAFPVLITDAL